MKAILLDKVGGEWKLVEDVEKPTPGKGQVLVKSLVTGVNPVEVLMQNTGILVTTWPIVLGCDASGVVVEVGEGVTKFKKGDGIFGCTALGIPGHSTFQEYHLMNERLSFKRPENVTVEDAATIGVALLTAGLAIVIGSRVALKPAPVTDASPWVVIWGAAGSVGQYAIQISKLVGYKVVAACSPANNELVKSVGADAAFNYKLSLEEQLAEIEAITGGDFTLVFDASGYAGKAGMAALATSKSKEQKYFSTTNDWDPVEPQAGVEVYLISLGELGRSGDARTEQINNDLAELVVQFEPLLEQGHLRPLEYVQIGEVGVGEVLKALDQFSSHKSGKKVIVRLANE